MKCFEAGHVETLGFGGYVRPAPAYSYTTGMMIRGASLSRRLQTHQPIRHGHELRGSFRSQSHGWSGRSYVTFSAVRLIKGTSPNERWVEYYSSFLIMPASSIRIISVRFLCGSCSLIAITRRYLGRKTALEIKVLIYNAIQMYA